MDLNTSAKLDLKLIDGAGFSFTNQEKVETSWKKWSPSQQRRNQDRMIKYLKEKDEPKKESLEESDNSVLCGGKSEQCNFQSGTTTVEVVMIYRSATTSQS